MKATFTINQLQFELQAETGLELFQQAAQIQEIFEAETECGCCESENIRYAYRVIDDYKFYELVCRECGAQFKFGQHKKDGSLFPKRKDDAGNFLPNRGWSVFQHGSREEAPPPARQQPAARPISPTITKFPSWDDAERWESWGKPGFVIEIEGLGYFHVPRGAREYKVWQVAHQ